MSIQKKQQQQNKPFIQYLLDFEIQSIEEFHDQSGDIHL